MVRWALKKAGVEEWLVETVVTLYEGAETAVRTTDGITDRFKVLIGLHQSSVLSTQLFIAAMEDISREISGGLPWELLPADDLLIAQSDELLH